jgi:phosphoribulokinase
MGLRELIKETLGKQLNKSLILKEDIKISNAIKAKQHILAAQTAEANKDLELAAKHIEEAQKCNKKIASIINIEVLKNKMKDLEENGHSEQANIIYENIINKIKTIIQFIHFKFK